MMILISFVCGREVVDVDVVVVVVVVVVDDVDDTNFPAVDGSVNDVIGG